MALELHSLFAKPIDRAIDGVIKADDEASLRLELEEYVITNEVATKLGRFLDAYNQYTNANGVWISGFFGCGKSHLLKMLALLLGHRDIEGRPAIDYFADKLTDDALLLGNLRRAVAIPAQSILFNIDQKADLVSKQDFDALLSVFQKVFDEMQGYYGKQAYIAQFERDLDAEGHFQPFRDAYARLAGQPWEQGRALVHLMKQRQAIAAAYAEVSGGSAEEARDILKRYREDYRSSIEDFALRVKDYIAARDREQPGFRLNFFVDEVGQYIAENVKLMTNLQTIAETLNTQCQGRAWLVVTAQQDMDAVIGDMERQQSNDFSKIMARFANRLPLNSADVAEVIQRRLLAKTDTAAASIGELYDDHAENLRTLFEFGDGTQRMKNFRDRAHFIRSYPFIPYQYELFQKAIRNLSDHNAFEGKHSSTGERSMLSVFHEVGKQMRHARLGEVATFDQMFEGIRTALKTNVQESILTAERQLDNPFALRVLKALFLVKYVDEFKSTARNIDILMRARLDLELKPHKARVEEALALLVQESYAQRHGECYEFLTDEEKDVEQRIKNIEIDTEQLNAEIQVLCFDDLISARKLKHHDSGQVFPISRRIDDHLYGRDHSLGIHLITPLRDAAERQDTALFMRSQGADDLFVVLPEDDRFFEDLLMYLRTERYVRQERGAEQRESIERIIREKGEQNASRRRHLLDQARQLLADARLIVRGEELDLRASDAKARIEQGFQTLVDRVHTSLAMLRGLSYSEADLPRHLAFTDDGTLTEAETEVLNKLKANARTGLRSTLKPLVAHFAAPPYGWDEAATLCQIAGLIGRGKLDARDGNGPLEGEALCKALPNTSAQAAITLQLQEEFSAAQVRRLRTLFEDLFDAKPQSSDGRGL
ncbi:MAG: BREX system P-loop protein BrxC, partial [Chromatiaceae bacterium]|nr:BREX system P-loop protein BrxC [Chromatiaceae bacterium]